MRHSKIISRSNIDLATRFMKLRSCHMRGNWTVDIALAATVCMLCMWTELWLQHLDCRFAQVHCWRSQQEVSICTWWASPNIAVFCQVGTVWIYMRLKQARHTYKYWHIKTNLYAPCTQAYPQLHTLTPNFDFLFLRMMTTLDGCQGFLYFPLFFLIYFAFFPFMFV